MVSKKQNILIITYALHQGGMEQSLSRLVTYIKDESWNVNILLTEQKGEWFDLFNDNFCKSTFIPESKAGALIHLLNIRKFIIESKCDLLILICDKYSQSIIPFLPKNIKIISVIRSDNPYYYHLSTTNKNSIDAYIVNSLKLHDSLEYINSTIPISIIHNGFSIPIEKIIKNNREFGMPLKLLFLGRIAAEKNVLILPEIIKRCKDLNLNVILNIIGDGELLPELISKIKLYNLDKYINIIGAVSKNETENWYLQSHILLFPSIGEGLPNVLLESQGCGCVPISNLLPKITDTVINNNVTGIIVKDNNIDDYVNAIVFLYNNENIWQSYSENGIKWIKENFSVDQEKKKYINLFEDVLNSKVIKRSRYNIFHIFRLIYIRDWTPISIKNLKHRIENIFMSKSN